jgi:hypothetical protein
MFWRSLRLFLNISTFNIISGRMMGHSVTITFCSYSMLVSCLLSKLYLDLSCFHTCYDGGPVLLSELEYVCMVFLYYYSMLDRF